MVTRATPSREFEDHWSTVGGIRAHALVSRRAGRTIDIVFVHGLVVASRSLVPAAAELASYGRVWLIDLPGCGLTQRPTRTPSVEELGAWLAEWLDTADLGVVALAGNSFGCQVVTELAGRHPERVCAAVLLGPAIHPGLRRAALALMPWLRRPRAERSTGSPARIGSPARMALSAGFAWLRRLVFDLPDRRSAEPSLASITVCEWLAFGLVRAAETVGSGLRYDLVAGLGRVEAPALVARGEYDRAAGPRWAAEAARSLRRGCLAAIPGAGHTCHYHAGPALSGVVGPFLERHCKVSSDSATP